jgi:hypothetical protein
MARRKSEAGLSNLSVDLALVFAVDVSSSVDSGDYKLQMDGIAAALRKPLTLQYVQAGPNQKIAISVVQWSSVKKQVVTLEWQILGDDTAIEAVARKIETQQRQWSPGGTGMAAALVFCVGHLKAFPLPARRKLIDVSGDGEDNENGNVPLARAAALANHITINGLPIISGSKLIQAYYHDKIIGGPGSFIEPAENVLAFGAAMERKLLRELQDLSS